MKFDLTKPIKTRGGEPVEIISDKARGCCPLVGYVGSDNYMLGWYEDGRHSRSVESANDLIQESVRKTLWVNVYGEGGGLVPGLVAHRTKEDADFQAVSDRIACVKVTYHDGQFDEE